MKKSRILAIESSCDETAAAVIEGNGEALLEIKSNVVASQIDLHQKFGGVFPEVASRAHAEKILPTIEETLVKSGLGGEGGGWQKAMEEIDAIAVTYGPGLIGSLMVGVAAAKTLAYALDKPIIPINHWEGHIYSNFVREFLISNSQFSKGRIPEFPSLVLTVSGGHTSLILMRDHGDYEILGRTLDDAAGEAFDKVAKLLGLRYPGGPEISALADRIKNKELRIKGGYDFPRPMVNEPGFDFSFSGLKTAVLYKVRGLRGEPFDCTRGKGGEAGKQRKLSGNERAMIAKEFQDAVVETLVKKAEQAAKRYQPRSLCLAGGVAANKQLRQAFKEMAGKLVNKPTIHIPPLFLTTDNAAMIGAAGYYHYVAHQEKKWYDVDADANALLV